MIFAEEYEKVNGLWFVQFAQRTLQKVLMDCALINNKEKFLFVMDNNPSKRGAAVKDTLNKIVADLVEMPPRSPDLNPIENICHNIKNSLIERVLRQRIIREDFQSFKQKVLDTLLQYDISVIDHTIETMNNRLQSIVKNGGYRTKY